MQNSLLPNSTASETLGNVFLGSVFYDPLDAFVYLNEGETATDSFGFTVADAEGLTSDGQFIVTITGEADAPVADSPISASFSEDDAANLFDLTLGVTDPDEIDSLTIADFSVTGSSAGLVLLGNEVSVDPGAYNALEAGSTSISVLNYDAVDSTGLSVSHSATITFTGVNDLPTSLDAAVTVAEDTPFVFALTDFGFADVDTLDQLQGITITRPSSIGTLALNGDAVVSGQSISHGDIVAGALTFSPLANENGVGYDSFDYTVNDGLADSLNQATLTIDVTAVDDLPTAADTTVTLAEDTQFVFAVADFGFADVDALDQLQSITITSLASVGKLELNGAGVTANQAISQSDISAGALTFTPFEDGNGVGYDSFNFTVNDGVADSFVPSTLTIGVTAVNDLPKATDNTVTATEDTAFVFAAANFGFTDVDTADQLQSITVTTLASTGTLALNGSAVTLGQSISSDDIAAGTLTFTPLANANGTGYDSFQFTVNDGVADSLASATMTIDVTAVNDLPTGTDNTVTATEDTAFVFATANFGFADVETDQLQSITVTTLASRGTLALNGSTVTLGQSISSDDIAAGTLTFTPLANANGTGYDSFQFTVNDGVADSLASATMTIDVTAVNDLPTATDNTVTATEDTAFVFAPVNFGFIDIDTADVLQGITVTTLSSTGTLALNGTAVTVDQSISHDDIFEGALTFTPLKDGNGIGYDSFNFTVNDGVSDSLVPSTLTIDVTAVNDLPTATDNTVTATEDTALVFVLADFGFTDVETDQLQSITVTTLNSTGTLLLDGSAVTIGQTISQSDISAGALTFTPLANDNGAGYDSFAYTVNDGVADSLTSATMTIDVTAVNDLPTATDNTVTATEDTAFVFAPVNFGFIDIDTADVLQGITVTTLSSTGTLALNGTAVTVDQSISHDDIFEGALTFTPLKDGNGIGYDSFNFTVNDGVSDSLVPSTLTIDVTAVNDLPTATDNTVTATEDTALVFVLADFGFTDVETEQLQGITVTTLNSTGTLLLDGSAVTIGQTISQSDISAGALTFTPLANDNGAGYDSFAYTVNDGVADSLTSATMTIDVTAVNDLPTATRTTQSPRQRTRRLCLPVQILVLSDIDVTTQPDDTLQGITVTTLGRQLARWHSMARP